MEDMEIVILNHIMTLYITEGESLFKEEMRKHINNQSVFFDSEKGHYILDTRFRGVQIRFRKIDLTNDVIEISLSEIEKPKLTDRQKKVLLLDKKTQKSLEKSYEGLKKKLTMINESENYLSLPNSSIFRSSIDRLVDVYAGIEDLIEWQKKEEGKNE